MAWPTPWSRLAYIWNILRIFPIWFKVCKDHFFLNDLPVSVVLTSKFECLKLSAHVDHSSGIAFIIIINVGEKSVA